MSTKGKPTSYKVYFTVNTLLYDRIHTIINEGHDPYPNTCEFQQLENVITALAAGKPNPYLVVGKRGGRSIDEYNCKIKDDIFWVMQELFDKRDAGEYENLESLGNDNLRKSDYTTVIMRMYYKARIWDKGEVRYVKYSQGSKIQATRISTKKGISRIYLSPNVYIDKIPRNFFDIETGG